MLLDQANISKYYKYGKISDYIKNTLFVEYLHLIHGYLLTVYLIKRLPYIHNST